MAVQVPSRLYRSRSQKMIAGVSGGLGEYFDVDPVLIRLLFVVTTFISGVGLLAYVVLWIVVPLQGDDGTPRMDAIRRDFDDLSSRVREQLDPRSPTVPGTPTVGSDPTGAPAGAPAGTYGDSERSATTAGFAATDPTTTSASAAAGSSATAGPMPAGDTVTTRLDPGRSEPSVADDPLNLSDPVGGRGYGTGAYETGAYASDSGSDSYGPRAYESPAYEAGASDGPSVSASYADPAPPVDRTRRRQHWAGAILIVLGVLFLAQNLGLLWWIHAKFIWPLVLVGIGAWLLFGRGRRG